MPPASGVAPLWTPRLRGLRFNYGEQMSTLGDTPRPLPEGLRPSGLPACTRCGADRPRSGLSKALLVGVQPFLR